VKVRESFNMAASIEHEENENSRSASSGSMVKAILLHVIYISRFGEHDGGAFGETFIPRAS
jgi:hypothetical protein